MALKTSTGYVRLIDISLGSDEKTLTVNWMTFQNENWRESNPRRMWQSISESGLAVFDLAIKEIQVNEKGENIEVITGYKPQTAEVAHELLKNLSGKDCNFKAINWQIV